MPRFPIIWKVYAIAYIALVAVLIFPVTSGEKALVSVYGILSCLPIIAYAWQKRICPDWIAVPVLVINSLIIIAAIAFIAYYGSGHGFPLPKILGLILVGLISFPFVYATYRCAFFMQQEST